MKAIYRFASILFLIAFLPVEVRAESDESTRVDEPGQHACTDGGGYPYRKKSDYILKELDLKPGDVVVDIGAGDGWWTQQMATAVGPKGTVHAGEVEQAKVDHLKKAMAKTSQIKPYLCPTDGTGLPENSCDLAFFSKVYHHLGEDAQIDYLRHLRQIVKPTGRVVVIEKYPQIATQGQGHGWPLSRLIAEAEEAGWIPVRCELITGTYHYIAIFVQKDLFPPEPSRKRPSTQRAGVQK